MKEFRKYAVVNIHWPIVLMILWLGIISYAFINEHSKLTRMQETIDAFEKLKEIQQYLRDIEEEEIQ